MSAGNMVGRGKGQIKYLGEIVSRNMGDVEIPVQDYSLLCK